MADLEVYSHGYQYEAGLTFVSPEHGYHDHIYREIASPDIEAFKALELAPHEPSLLAWVDLNRQATVVIKHDTTSKDFGKHRGVLLQYPAETLRGHRQRANESYLVTDRSGDELQFMTDAEIVASGKVPAYTAKWLGKLAQGNMYPNMFRQIQELMR